MEIQHNNEHLIRASVLYDAILKELKSVEELTQSVCIVEKQPK